jgi:electron transfer flavoprotein beta subunit
MGIKKAKTKEVKTVSASQLGANRASAIEVDRVYLPQRSKQTQVLSGEPRQVAQQLVEKLKFEARVI